MHRLGEDVAFMGCLNAGFNAGLTTGSTTGLNAGLNARTAVSLSLLLLVGGAAVRSGVTPAAEGAPARVVADFNGDGYSDLVVGSPGEDVGGKSAAGSITVLYGSAKGVRARRAQVFTQATAGVGGEPGKGDKFGWASAAGFFNDDRYADLAVGAPGDDAGADAAAGSVTVLRGTPDGLAVAGSMVLRSQPDDSKSRAGHRFGWSLATGDTDGDQPDELAVGAPTYERTGQVFVFGQQQDAPAGAPPAGVLDDATATGAAVPAAGRAARFGHAVALGDPDGDGVDDLAVGVPFADDAARDAGAVDVFEGVQGKGLRTRPTATWTQDSAGVQGKAESARGSASAERFGWAVAFGSVDRGGYDDLLVGVPGEAVGGRERAGALHVLRGSPGGVSAGKDEYWHRGSDGVRGKPRAGDEFGSWLAVGDFDSDGRADVAATAGRNAVQVLRGARRGLTSAGDRVLSQSSRGVPGSTDKRDRWGEWTAAGAFGRGGADDLAVGAPGKRRGKGVVALLYGHRKGLNGDRDARAFAQFSDGVPGDADRGDRFGHVG